MKRRLALFVIASFATLAFQALAAEQVAKKTSPVTRIELLSEVLAKTENISRVEIKEIEISTRLTDIPHKHPCTVIGQILEGSIVFQIEDQAEIILKAGDAFIEPADTQITRFDNLGPGKARFLACYLISDDDGPLIEMLK